VPLEEAPWKPGERQWFVKHSHDPWLYAGPQTTSWETRVPLRFMIILWNTRRCLDRGDRYPVSEVSHCVGHPTGRTGTLHIKCLKDNLLLPLLKVVSLKKELVSMLAVAFAGLGSRLT